MLDEPLSQLDRTDRAPVARTLERLLAGRTATIVTHRIMTLNINCSGASFDNCNARYIDDILVLDEGRRVEWGPLSQLLHDPTSRFAQLLAVEQAADGRPAS